MYHRDLGKAVFFHSFWPNGISCHFTNLDVPWKVTGIPISPKPQLYLLGWLSVAMQFHQIRSKNFTLFDGSKTPQVILSNLEANPISIHVHVIFTYMGVSKNTGGPPKWMVKIMENLIKMGWFGGKTHYFGKHPHLVDFYGSYGCRTRSDQCINAFFKASRSPQRAASNISSHV